MFTAIPTVVGGDALTSSLWNGLASSINAGVARPIGETTLGGTSAAISFTSIPADWSHLRLVAVLRGDTAAASIASVLRCNGDTGANYNYVTQILGSSVASAGGASQSAFDPFATKLPAASAAASSFGALVVDIASYASATPHKQVAAFATCDLDGTTGNMISLLMAGRWKNTAPLTSLSLAPASGNFVAGTRVTLYGLGGI